MAEEITGTPQERLEETFTSPYPTDEVNGEHWNALLVALAAEFEELDQARRDIYDSKFVDDAVGEQLEKLASIFQLEKRNDESTAEFRARIKTALRSQLASGTIDEIEEVVSVLLDIPVEEVNIIETTDLEPATIQIDVDPGDFDTSILGRVMEDVVAAGVDVGLQVIIEPDDTLAFDDAVITEFPVTIDSLSIGDAYTLEFPVTTDTLVLSDDHRVRADEPQQAFWGEARWDIDRYDTALYKFTLTKTSGLAVSDAGLVPDHVTTTDEPAVSDTVTVEFEQVRQSYWDEGIWNSSTHVW